MIGNTLNIRTGNTHVEQFTVSQGVQLGRSLAPPPPSFALQ
jgi:hypothetical protein